MNPTITSEGGNDHADTSALWADFDPETLARLALAPVWTYPLARQLGQAGDLGSTELLLDALHHAGLIETQSTFNPTAWTLNVGPVSKSSSVSGPQAHYLLDRAREKASRIGLLSPAESERMERNPGKSSRVELRAPSQLDPLLSTSSDEAVGEVTPQTLMLPDLQLRSRGLRFRDSSGLREGQQVELEFVRETPGPETVHVFDGVVAATGGDSWSGRSVVIIFGSPASPRTSFPADELYAQFQVRSQLRPMLLNRVRTQGVSLPLVLSLLTKSFEGKAQRSLPAAIQPWLGLARFAGSEEGVSKLLEGEFKAALEKDRTTEAEALLQSAELLALALGGSLETAVLLGRRRLEAVYRRTVDRRMLETYIKRFDLLQTFENLVHAAQGPWALHYLGVGGVGKTMLMRHLTATYSELMPVSRVDFDFLSPDYPVRRPGQLLLELGDALRGFGGTRSDDFFLKFQDEAGLLHRELEAAPPATDELASLNHPRFHSVLELFCEFLRLLLSQPSRPLKIPRVILILDTCEELARLRSDGAFQPAVAATFLILDRVHSRVPEVRAVFAGRRLLANRGADWEVENRPPEPAFTGARPAVPTDNLRLEIVRGFTLEEARQLIVRCTQPRPDSEGKPITPELVQAMLDASPETSLPLKIKWSSPSRTTTVRRYNPFQLALYAEWFLDEPELVAATIAAGDSDPYIEKRILGRLRQPDVLAALPHLVLLRRSDEAMLRKVLRGLNDTAFGHVFRELCQLEWIEYTTAASGNSQLVFLEIERRLRPRIERCLRAERPRDLDLARSELAPWLRAAVLETDGKTALPTGRIVVEHLEAALRLLQAAEAAEIWALVEERIAQESAWAWARQVCERLLAEDEGEWDPLVHSPAIPPLVAPVAIRTHVHATHLAALRRLDSSRATPSGWKTLVELPFCPDPALHEWLALRIRFAEITLRARSHGTHGGAPLVDLAEALQALVASAAVGPSHPFRSPQLAGSALAALDASLEMAESGLGVLPPVVKGAELSSIPHLPDALQAQWTVAFVRWHRLTERLCPPPLLIALSLANAPGATASPQADPWLDWPLDPTKAFRVELEIWRELAFAGEREAAYRRINDTLNPGVPLISADHHALAAHGFRTRLERVALPRSALETFSKLPGLLEPWVPDRVAHREVPPLFVVLADAWLAHGEGTIALQLLYEGTAKQTDPAAVRFAENQRLKIVRRLRLDHEALELIAQRTDSAHPATPAEREFAWAARRLIEPGPSPRLPESSDAPNFETLTCAAWKVQELLTDEGRAAALAEGRRVFGALRSYYRGAESVERNVWFELFAIEYRVLSSVSYPKPNSAAQAFRDELEKLPTKFHDWQRRLLSGAWTFQSISRDLLKGETEGRVAAFWALEEGELLALRHPEAGARLLDFAASFFREEGEVEDVSAFIAGLRATIAVMHTHSIRTPRQRLLQLQSIYERLSRTLHLPPPEDWKPLLAQPGAPGGFFRQSISEARTDWQPWLQRLEKCLEVVRGTLGAENVLQGAVQAELAARQEETKRTLPLELRIWLPKTPVPEVVSAAPVSAPAPASFPGAPKMFTAGSSSNAPLLPAPPARTSPWSSVYNGLKKAVKGLQKVGAVLITLGIAGIILVSPIYAFVFILDLFDRGVTNPEIWKGQRWLVALCGFLVVTGFIYWAFLRIRAWLARHCEVLITLRAGDPVSVNLKFAALQHLISWPFWPHGAVAASPPEGSWHSTAMAPQIGVFPDHILALLRGWIPRLSDGPMGLAVACDRPLAESPWEFRLLTTLTSPTDKKADQATLHPWTYFNPYRWLARRDGVPPINVAEADTIFLMSSQRWQTALETSWKAANRRTLFVLHDWFEIEALVEWPKRIRALHWVGRPVDGPSGLALKVELHSQLTRSNVASLSGPSEVLVTPGRRGLERIPLLIVQAEPSPIVEYTETDRREVGKLRGFCQELFTAGSVSILMLPSFHPDLSSQITELIASHVGRATRLDRRALLNLGAAVRTAIAEWAPPPPDASATAVSPPSSSPSELQRELALNVTLFHSHDFKRLVVPTPRPIHA